MRLSQPLDSMQSQPENQSLGIDMSVGNGSQESGVNLTDVLVSKTHAGHTSIQLAGWRWHETGTFIVVSLFLLTGSLVKLAYHHTSLHQHLPESCILILLGTAFELMSFLSHFQAYIPRFSSEVFFFLLLPPIILESAYSLHDRIFFTNLGTIVLYAIVGTLINIFAIGPTIFAIGLTGVFGPEITANLTLIECLIFSTLISAVDPVAVLAIFQEIGVNKGLYFLVFGESLLNDAVVITLYNSITIFAGSVAMTPVNLLLGGLNFLTVSGGGLVIGILWGVLTALITKHTQEVRVVEPMIVIVIAYLSYVTAELFHFSGIISIIGCGLMQLEYAKYNISTRSYITIKYFTRNVSTVADVIIFFFLGKVLVRETHVWSTSFILIATASCVVFRFLSVFSLTWIANNVFQRIHRIKLEEQLVMAYGGLRGAIAFSLAISLDESEVKNARLFVSSTLFVILFTVFVLGSTTKTVVRLLRVQIEEKEDPKMFLFTNDKLVEGLMSGLEDVTGNQTYFHWIHRLKAFNEKYVKRFLVRDWVSNYTDFATTYQKVKSKTSLRPRSILSSHNITRTLVGIDGSVEDSGSQETNNNVGRTGSGTRIKKSAVMFTPTHAVNHQANGSISTYDGVGRVNTSSTTLVTDDEGLVKKIRGPRQAFESATTASSRIDNESIDSQGGWQLIRNAVKFTSRIKTGSNSGSSADSRRRRRRSSPATSPTTGSGASSRKHSIMNLVRDNSEERERNEARRQLTSALNRTSFFQLPGSIFIEDIEDDAMKRRSATRIRMQRGSIPESIGSHLTENSRLLGAVGGQESMFLKRRRSSVHEDNISRTLAAHYAHDQSLQRRPIQLQLGSSRDRMLNNNRSSYPFP